MGLRLVGRILKKGFDSSKKRKEFIQETQQKRLALGASLTAGREGENIRSDQANEALDRLRGAAENSLHIAKLMFEDDEQ